jgi:hypothetical protein
MQVSSRKFAGKAKYEKQNSKSQAHQFCRETFCLDKNGNFGSLNIKFEIGTRIQSLNLSTGHWQVPKIFAVVASFWRIPKKTYHTLPRLLCPNETLNLCESRKRKKKPNLKMWVKMWGRSQKKIAGSKKSESQNMGNNNVVKSRLMSRRSSREASTSKAPVPRQPPLKKHLLSGILRNILGITDSLPYNVATQK